MKLNKYLPFAIIYFFLNSLGLPLGLTYTALLCPFFYWWILVTRRQEILIPFFICLLPFIVIQVLVTRVDIHTYFISLINLAAVYIFCQTFYTFLKNCRDIESIFKKLLIINFVLCLVAIPLYFTPYADILWIDQWLTQGISSFKRLKLFTYEASYYSTLFTPLFFFYFLQVVRGRNRGNAWFLLSMLLLPLALSFSMGVICAIIIAIIIAFLFHGATIIRKKRTLNFIACILLAIVAGLLVMVIFFPGNALFLRMNNILTGNDLSGHARTTDSFVLANRILNRQESHWWGIGPGQIKIVGAVIIRRFYAYPADYTVITIPNAVAETWTLFGAIGLLIRFTAECTLFLHTKVWRNYYRLLLFSFIFIYQFTGSFVTNLGEYAIWILAFTPVFPRFNVIRQPQAPPKPMPIQKLSSI